MFVSNMWRHGIAVGFLTAATCAHGQVTTDLAAPQLQLQQQRERALAEQAAARLPDVRLPRESVAAGVDYPQHEAPCFVIERIKLDGDDASRIQWALTAAADARGRCLGSGGINTVLARVQNALIGAGYVTTRVVAAPQDLRSGTLVLALVPGRIRAVRFAAPEGDAAGATAGSIKPPTHYWNTLPASPGDLLNLRDIEQGLENFKRVPTAEADIQMVPGSAPGDSDLLVKWRQSQWVRLSLSVDDGGSDATGKYQGNATLSLDNPFGLQDLFYFSFSNDLSGNGPNGRRGPRGHGLFYSIPFGYWLLALTGNDYGYRQSIAGASQNYVYSGSSRNLDLKLSRVVYRNAVRKVGAFVRGYQRNSKNFIDDTEIEVQRRKMGGFELGVTDKEFIGDATLDTSLAYKRGTGAFGTLTAPEEAFGEGMSRPHIITGGCWPGAAVPGRRHKGHIAAAAEASGLKSLTIKATDNLTGLPKTYV